MLNALLRGHTDYSAVVFLAPYWGLPRMDQKWHWWYMMTTLNSIPCASRVLPEVPLDPTKMPGKNNYHWAFDTKNRLQRRFFYTESILNQLNELYKFETLEPKELYD